MCLVNGDEADLDVFQLLEEERGFYSLGRDIEQLDFPEDAVVQHLHRLLTAEAGVQGMGCYAAPPQVLHLIVHQRDEGCDDEAHAGDGKCGHLERDGFPSAGGHEAESVAAARDAVDYLFLYASEAVVSPILFQNLFVCHCCFFLDGNVFVVSVVFKKRIKLLRGFTGYSCRPCPLL